MSGPFSGYPTSATGDATLGLREPKRSTFETRHPQHGEVVLRIEHDDGRGERASVLPVDARVIDACDHMRVRHHELGAGDPARPLDAETARDAGDPHHAFGCRSDVPDPGRSPPSAGDGGGRADEHAERVDALERLEQPLGRKHLVDPGEDRGLLNGLAAAPTVQAGRGAPHRRPRSGRRPAAAPSSMPAAESRARRPGITPSVERSVTPRIPARLDKSVPPSTAPPRATSGA